MEKLQLLIQDILAHCEGHSVSIYCEGYVGDSEVSRRIVTDTNSFVDIYINKTTDIVVMHKWAVDRSIVGFNVSLQDAGFDFNPAIEEATRLWNIYKATNL